MRGTSGTSSRARQGWTPGYTASRSTRHLACCEKAGLAYSSRSKATSRATTPRPERAWEEHELHSDLARKLAELTEIERVCFVLKHLEQWRAKEIAAELQLNEGQVKQAVFRAVKKLRVSMHSMKREPDG